MPFARFALFMLLAAMPVLAAALQYAESPEGPPSPPPAGYFPVPDGFDFPAGRDRLERAVARQDRAAYRRHGWYLFAGLNQERAIEGVPGLERLRVWQSWFSVSQAFARRGPEAPAYRSMAAGTDADGTPALKALNAGTFPTLSHAQNFHGELPDYPGHEAPDGVLFANNGDVMVAGEYYNWPALSHLRGRGLYLESELKRLLDGGERSVPVFPREAVATKNMYWPVAQDRLTALPVWDNTPQRPPYGYNGYETWPRAVAIDASRSEIPDGETAKVETLYGVKVPGFDTPRVFEDARVVSLDGFIHLRVDDDLWQALDEKDKTLLHHSANWAYDRDFQPGDAIALIALHVNTKEIPSWAMQTFWWHDRPDEGPFAENRPEGLLQGAMRNYLMATAYSQVTPREYDGTNHVAYNPYVELVIHPIPTNCQNCHARAAWPTADDRHPDRARYVDTPAGRHEVKPSDPYFDGLLRTDYLWTVPDRAIAEPTEGTPTVE